MPNFRRSARYQFTLQVLLDSAGQSRPTLTEDISFHGVFVRTDEPEAPNQLLKFIVVDPDTEAHLPLLGIVARSIATTESDDVRPPGMGVSLFGNSRQTEAQWIDLVRRVKAKVEAKQATAAQTSDGPAGFASAAPLSQRPTPPPVPRARPTNLPSPPPRQSVPAPASIDASTAVGAVRSPSS